MSSPLLWIVNQFANTPDLPGHTRQYEVASGLLSLGWNVEVFASDFNLSQRQYRRLNFPFICKNEYYDGIAWTWLWTSPYKFNNWKRKLNMLLFCFHLALRLAPVAIFRRLFGLGPDVILASSPQLPAAFICLCIALLCRIPFVLEVRDLWPQVLIDQGGKRPDSITVRLLGWMEQKLYLHSSVVVVLAKGAESYVRERGARKTAWLPNGPDLSLFTPRPLPPDRSFFTVLYAGAHGEANSLDNVIASAKLLEHRQIMVKFIFIGDGPEKPSLIRLAADLKSVCFRSPISKSLIPDLMSQCDAILLSLKDIPLYRYGVSPNKLYDAYALGRPVITTVAGSINEEVEEYRLGVTSPPGDPTALADAIQSLIETPYHQRKAMASRAIELAHSTYSRQRINLEYNSLLRRLISP